MAEWSIRSLYTIKEGRRSQRLSPGSYLLPCRRWRSREVDDVAKICVWWCSNADRRTKWYPNDYRTRSHQTRSGKEILNTTAKSNKRDKEHYT